MLEILNICVIGNDRTGENFNLHKHLNTWKKKYVKLGALDAKNVYSLL